MNPELSKSAHDLLAKQPTPEAHPSPDLLNGYVEQALSDAERTQVLTHLSACAECRDVVFLATGAVEEEMETALVAAAVPRLDPALVAVPGRMAAAPTGAVAAGKEKPARNWWRWAAPLAALVIVGSTALIERDRIAEMVRPPSGEMAPAQLPAKAPAPTAKTGALPAATPGPALKQLDKDTVAQDVRGAVSLPESDRAYKKRDEGQTRSYAREDALRRKALESELANNFQMAKPKTAAPVAEGKAMVAQPPASGSTTAEVTSAAPLVQADNADLAANATDALKGESLSKSSLVANNQAAAGSVAAMPMVRRQAGSGHWRIGTEGQLERATGTGTWTQKLASEEVRFRTVATVGSDVWAGGDDGALFHSSDGGEHFNRVALSGNGQAARGAIVSIHFDTAQQGKVSSDSGATWTTSDGGRTWSRQ